jgi:hypothetical protein
MWVGHVEESREAVVTATLRDLDEVVDTGVDIGGGDGPDGILQRVCGISLLIAGVRIASAFDSASGLGVSLALRHRRARGDSAGRLDCGIGVAA